jgi:hypothetical protein
MYLLSSFVIPQPNLEQKTPCFFCWITTIISSEILMSKALIEGIIGRPPALTRWNHSKVACTGFSKFYYAQELQQCSGINPGHVGTVY